MDKLKNDPNDEDKLRKQNEQLINKNQDYLNFFEKLKELITNEEKRRGKWIKTSYRLIRLSKRFLF